MESDDLCVILGPSSCWSDLQYGGTKFEAEELFRMLVKGRIPRI